MVVFFTFTANKMKTYRLPRIHTFFDWKKLEATQPTIHDAPTIIGEQSCDIYDDQTGALILKFRKRAIPTDRIQLAKSIYGNIDQVMKPSFSRNAAAGKVDLDQIRKFKPHVHAIHVSNRLGTKAKVEVKGGKILTEPVSNPVKSYKAGYTYWRFQGGCAMPTGFTKEFPDKWRASLPFFNAIGERFEANMPDRAAIHRKAMEGWEEYLIGDTALSTVAINVNYESAYHVDRGDLNEGFSTLTVCEFGTYEGGLYMVPEYGLAIDVREGDLVLSQSHKYWHGNTKIVPKTEGARRMSFITYLKGSIPKAVNRK